MPLATICMSHTPLLHSADPGAEVRRNVDDAFARLRKFAADFDPELVVLFAPDHFNGFFYDVMPPFCVGVRAEGAGDYGLPTGPLPVAADAALGCIAALHEAAVDTAVSYRMTLDHGFVQPLEILFGEPDARPIVPVFVNCAAPPLPAVDRCRQLGEAIGRYAANSGQRVLLIGSGGLSHDPPIPRIDTASDEAAAMLIDGRRLMTPELRHAREDRVKAAAREFAETGTSLLPLNPAWDQAVIGDLLAGSWENIGAYTDAWISGQGGRGGHEIRTWIAALAAQAAAGPYSAALEFYDPIPVWIAGMAMLHARQS